MYVFFVFTGVQKKAQRRPKKAESLTEELIPSTGYILSYDLEYYSWLIPWWFHVMLWMHFAGLYYYLACFTVWTGAVFKYISITVLYCVTIVNPTNAPIKCLPCPTTRGRTYGSVDTEPHMVLFTSCGGRGLWSQLLPFAFSSLCKWTHNHCFECKR